MANSNFVAGKTASGLVRKGITDAFWTALIALGMFVLYIGLKTDQNMDNKLIIVQRWGLLAVIVAIAAAGRFMMTVFVQPYLAARKARKAKAAPVVKEPGVISRNFNVVALGLLLIYPFVALALRGPQGSLVFVDNFGIQILIYVMLAWGLNIVVGLAGLLDLGYVAFYAVGAYSYALLSAHFGLSFWVLLPLSGIFAALWGMILGFPVLRLRGDYLAIVTLAFGEIIRIVLINWTDVTKGTFGVSNITKASLFGLYSFDIKDPNNFVRTFGLPMSTAWYKIFLFYVILALCMLTAYVTIRLRRMPIGRAWEALREDEIACRSLGINTVTTKLTAFATGAMFGGFAGSFFAARQGFVSPESFVFLESAVILAIVVLGGMGSLRGIAIAAIVMIGGTEALRYMGFLKFFFGEDFTPELYRMLIFGLAMVVVMIIKPRGFVGTREPTAFLKERKAVSGSFTKEGHG
ncbi:high-affinity branched-chain amino acid ABC transporter permease LivM [Rhizobium sp. P38BS-XIX]|uniref:high-affinity branched-chain amino acid ABC transporter permease LivM n=1 Tax=Rhizobium sp. P38BS-XIX TaxID=2726740 RepID=UPI0014575A2D|nr:high-affinity branched-chain amino acid ABC transporter permease LivM [Rhizobium sp. P38BS-XIX]NLR96954.1 high-affinity branched-chain amino acid ABC transporter permease LivM [Rhizobium sp. P38BS-XIX]